MDGNILVSIIIPVYNVASYISEALESVIRQSYKNLEIIVIDDGSSDESGAICDKYAEVDNRIVVVHQDNKGLSTARNIGLNLMTGSIVAFLDSDDAYEPSYIEKMLTVMSQNDVDLVVCRFAIEETSKTMVQSGNETIIPPIKEGKYTREEMLRALIDDEINQSVWNKLYCASLWKDIRFPDGHVFEDIDTTYRILNNCKRIFIINDVLYMYRKRNTSITGYRTKTKRYDCALACSHLEAFIDANSPGIFTANHLNKIRKIRLYQLISIYGHLFCYSDEHSRKTAEAKQIRNQIIERLKDLDIRQISFLMVISCWMIQYIPGAFQVFFPLVCYFFDGLKRLSTVLVQGD